MLKNLRIKNFRTHKDTTLKFCSGINGIIGISGSGKTNILRALKYVFTLRPVGPGVFKRNAKQSMVIQSRWSDIGKVTYAKEVGKANARYIVNDDEPYRKFGVTVPDDIVNILNLSEINFHGQFDGPFLIFSGPGEISRKINKITGADEFDTWSSNVNSRIKKLKYAWKDADFRAEKYRIEKNKLKGIKKIEPQIIDLKEMSDKLEELRERREVVIEIHSRLTGLRRKAAKHKRIMNQEARVKRLARLEKKINLLEEDIDLVENLKTVKKAEIEQRKRHGEIVSEYTKTLKKRKQCPTCLSSIKKTTIRRLKNAIRLAQ